MSEKSVLTSSETKQNLRNSLLRSYSPQDLEQNIRWRLEISKKCETDQLFRQNFIDACAGDIVFFCNAVMWTYDPRREDRPKKMPWILYPFQEDCLDRVEQAITEQTDLAVLKSRDLGWSWMVLLVAFHQFLFKPDVSILMLSRNEKLVDELGNSDSLFYKLDMMLKYLPIWMCPLFKRKKLMLQNLENGALVTGESTTANAGVGGRRSWVLLDEFAKFGQQIPNMDFDVMRVTRDVTRCRIFVSTPQGAANAFGQMVSRGTVPLVVTHWTGHPEKSEGLYWDGAAQSTNRFWVEGRGNPRSPWYDEECKRCDNQYEIAGELDCDLLSSQYNFFEASTIQRYSGIYCRNPILRGELDYIGAECQPVGFQTASGGPLQIWFNPDRNSCPPFSRYSIGCDIAMGTSAASGRSNSVAAVYDVNIREKVAEYTTSGMGPEEFARVVVSLARWFRDRDGNGSFMIWEKNGPGSAFGREVIKYGYRNIWYAQDIRSIAPHESMVPGWQSSPDNKRDLLSAYRMALKDEAIVNRSREAVDECLEYIVSQTGNVEHAKSIATRGNTLEGRSLHGDRVIADALAWLAMEIRTKPEEEESEVQHSLATFGARREEWESRQYERENDFW